MKRRFFIALLPPEDIQERVNEIKQYFAQVYQSRAAQKSPPHITLQPPFEWQLDQLSVLEQSLLNFTKSQAPVPIILSGFGAFIPRVIYINVSKTSELMALQKSLVDYLKTSLEIVESGDKDRPFAPHMTVAFRDLTKPNFRVAWPEFQNQQLEFKFTASRLTLLIHDGQRWNINSEFPFG